MSKASIIGAYNTEFGAFVKKDKVTGLVTDTKSYYDLLVEAGRGAIKDAGLEAKDIHRQKGLKKSQQILDHMGSTELAANLFRATQTEEKLRRENIQGKQKANQTHFEVGKKVRQTIKELGGTMPENLPTEESIKKIENKEKKQIGKGN